MFLLRQVEVTHPNQGDKNLHSNMFLLRLPVIFSKISPSNSFTFQYVSIKTGYGISDGYGIRKFTFQYVSIKTKHIRQHSAGSVGFTFQYVSIKTFLSI